MIRFSKAVMNATAKIINKSLKDGKGYPSSVTMKDMDGKTHKLDKAHYMGLYEAQNVFLIKNGRYPNYTSLNSTSSNSLVIDYQNNGYTCCPTSLSMASQLLFNYKSEQTCAKTLGTVIGSGTSPDKLIANAPKLGFKAIQMSRSYSNVKKSIDKGYPVIIHYETGGATKPKCTGFTNNYGHYALIYDAYSKNLTKYYRVADPTKGLKLCKASEIDKATNGRSIYYYSIRPL